MTEYLFKEKAKIVVFGIGYVGLSNAILLAQENTVVVTDLSKDRVDLINSRTSPIIDPDIQDFLQNKKLHLTATTDPNNAVAEADFVIVATPTNYEPETNYFDTTSVESVIALALELNPSVNIVVKSTIPVGFIERIRDKFKTQNAFFVPEFLREGQALHDNLYPSRIIIGDNRAAAHWFSKLLTDSAISKNIPILFLDPAEAEAVKLFSNTYLAMRVAYFNELDSYALAHDLNCKQIIEGVSLDPRIGSHYNNPSFGYGGYCLPKDTKQLLANFSSIPQKMIEATVHSNETRMDFLAEVILSKKPKIIGVYKLAMKTGSDNWRDSAIQGLMSRLKKNGVELIIYDPTMIDKEFFGYSVYKDLSSFKSDSDLVVTNRMDKELQDIIPKVFTRDVFGRD